MANKIMFRFKIFFWILFLILKDGASAMPIEEQRASEATVVLI